MTLSIHSVTENDYDAWARILMLAYTDPKAGYPGGEFLDVMWPNIKSDQGHQMAIERVGAWHKHLPPDAVLKVVDSENPEGPEVPISIIAWAEYPEPMSPIPGLAGDYWPNADLKARASLFFDASQQRRQQEYLKGPNITLLALMTDPKHQKKGAATMLMDRMVQHIDHKGWAAQVDSTLGAVNLCKKFGFETLEFITRPEPPGCEHLPRSTYCFMKRQPKS